MPRASATRSLYVRRRFRRRRSTIAQRLACLRLIRSEQVGPATFRELINHFGGAEAALDALPELAHRGGRRRPIQLCPRNVAEAELAAAAKAGARPLFTIEPGYPAALARVEAPPPMLYVKGRPELLDRPSLAIVGSRNASAAGQRIARQLAAALGGEGLAIVSGLARGIDAAAHEAALPTGTIAVVAGGIDCVYPPEHAALQERIGCRGLPSQRAAAGLRAARPGLPEAQSHYLRRGSRGGDRRGRTTVGLTHHGAAGRRAGARGDGCARSPLDPRAEGTNQLLKDGATLVTGPADVLAALGAHAGIERKMSSVPTPARPAAHPAPTPFQLRP